MKPVKLHILSAEDWNLIKEQFAQFAQDSTLFVSDNKGSLLEAQDVYVQAFLCYTQLLELYGMKRAEQGREIVYSFTRKLWLKKLSKRNVDSNFVRHRREFLELEDAFHEIDAIHERSQKTAEKLADTGEPSRTLILENIGRRKELMSVAPRLGFVTEDKAFAHLAKSVRKLIKLTDAKEFEMKAEEFEALLKYILDKEGQQAEKFTEEQKVCIAILSRVVVMVRNYVIRSERLELFTEMQQATAFKVNIDKPLEPLNKTSRKMKPVAVFSVTAGIALAISAITTFGLMTAFAPKHKSVKLEQDSRTTPTEEIAEKPDLIFDESHSFTAFALNSQGLFLTTASAVSGSDVVHLGNSESQSLTGKVVFCDSLNNLALVQCLVENTTRLPYMLASDNSNLGEIVFTIGFPESNIFFSDGTHNTMDINGKGMASFSNSSPGAPLISDKGQIVGMITGKSKNQTNLAGFVPVDKIQSAIERFSIDQKEKLNLPTRNALFYDDRPEQIKKLKPFVYQVKGV